MPQFLTESCVAVMHQDTPGKYTSIREHPWFAPLNWIALEKGVISPSIFPRACMSMYKPVSDELSWTKPRRWAITVPRTSTIYTCARTVPRGGFGILIALGTNSYQSIRKDNQPSYTKVNTRNHQLSGLSKGSIITSTYRTCRLHWSFSLNIYIILASVFACKPNVISSQFMQPLVYRWDVRNRCFRSGFQIHFKMFADSLEMLNYEIEHYVRCTPQTHGAIERHDTILKETLRS